MAPNEKEVLDALRNTTISVFKTDPDSLTVRKVRAQVVDALDLEDDFFAGEKWKAKSKDFIQELATELNEQGNVEEKASSPTKPAPKVKAVTIAKLAPAKKDEPAQKVGKRAAPAKKVSKPAKRTKKNVATSDDEDDDDNSSSEGSFAGDDSDVEESAQSSAFASDSEEERPKKKQISKQAAAGKGGDKKRKTVTSDSEQDASESAGASDSDASGPPAKKRKADVKKSIKKPALKTTSSKKTESKSKEVISDDDGSDEERKSPVAKATQAASKEPEPKPTKTNEDSESEMSIVLDEPPKKKRQKSTSTSTNKEPKSAKPAAGLSQDEQHLKLLQTQLKKCGIKKIYQFTLSKQFGDDTKSKIKFLQKELHDVGMRGKFSESRAKEIKEQRELMDDLEAVKQGEKSWGADDDGEGRARRSRGVSGKRKSLREESKGSDEEEDNAEEGDSGDEDVEDEDEDVKSKNTGRNDGDWARKDLAMFDDDEDDSD